MYTRLKMSTCRSRQEKKLKGRRWVADYEDGLQKIYYKENIIATIYAMADWFSPADIEAPTLEFVCFHNRKDYKPMKISEIPPVAVSYTHLMSDEDTWLSCYDAVSKFSCQYPTNWYKITGTKAPTPNSEPLYNFFIYHIYY